MSCRESGNLAGSRNNKLSSPSHPLPTSLFYFLNPINTSNLHHFFLTHLIHSSLSYHSYFSYFHL